MAIIPKFNLRKFRFSVLTCELGSKALVSVGEDVHVLVVVPRSGGNQGDDGGGDKGHSEATIGWIKKRKSNIFQDDGGGNWGERN